MPLRSKAFVENHEACIQSAGQAVYHPADSVYRSSVTKYQHTPGEVPGVRNTNADGHSDSGGNTGRLFRWLFLRYQVSLAAKKRRLTQE